VVLAATRFAWRGQDAAAVLPGYSAEEAAQMRQARRETLRLDTKQHTLSAMAPVALALRPGEIRTSRQGVLAIDYDLRPIDARPGRGCASRPWCSPSWWRWRRSG